MKIDKKCIFMLVGLKVIGNYWEISRCNFKNLRLGFREIFNLFCFTHALHNVLCPVDIVIISRYFLFYVIVYVFCRRLMLVQH
jgi:hypothetical protein